MTLRLLQSARVIRFWRFPHRSIVTKPPSSDRQTFPSEELKEKLHQEYLKSKRRILTVPNILTFSRIAVTPAVGYFIWNGMNSQALTCFAFAAATDLFDGLIARVFKQESDFGAILDPIADRFLLTTCIICLYNAAFMPLWIVKALVMRDMSIFIGGAYIRYTTFSKPPTLRQYFDIKTYPTLGFEPTKVSKVHTALLCVLTLTHLSCNHMVGLPMYDKLMTTFHILVGLTGTFSAAQYLTRFTLPDTLHTSVPKSKGL